MTKGVFCGLNRGYSLTTLLFVPYHGVQAVCHSFFFLMLLPASFGQLLKLEAYENIAPL